MLIKKHESEVLCWALVYVWLAWRTVRRYLFMARTYLGRVVNLVMMFFIQGGFLSSLHLTYILVDNITNMPQQVKMAKVINDDKPELRNLQHHWSMFQQAPKMPKDPLERNTTASKEQRQESDYIIIHIAGNIHLFKSMYNRVLQAPEQGGGRTPGKPQRAY